MCVLHVSEGRFIGQLIGREPTGKQEHAEQLRNHNDANPSLIYVLYFRYARVSFNSCTIQIIQEVLHA